MQARIQAHEYGSVDILLSDAIANPIDRLVGIAAGGRNGNGVAKILPKMICHTEIWKSSKFGLVEYRNKSQF